MMSILCSLYIIVVAFFTLVAGNIDATIGNLSARIQSMQVRHTVESKPPLVWHKDKGLYESDVKLYFHGDRDMYDLRKMFNIFDNNMFATAWITIGVLEAYRFGKAPKPNENQIQMSVEAMGMYADKNYNFANSIRTFWPQVYNKTLYTWQSTPQNLLDLFDLTYGVKWDTIYKVLKNIGQEELAKTIQTLLSEREIFKHAFMIPADFDDTFVNLGLGTILKEMSNEFPNAYAEWQKANTNLTSILTALKKYAYRPLSTDKRINTIDPRTYTYIRKFLENATANGEDIALVPTWVEDLEEVKTRYYKGVDMPFNVNNVDCTVAANVVYGLTNAILTGVLNDTVMNDPEIEQIYRNTSNLIAFEINSNFTDRKDLALTYYPSEFEFYWFVARTYTQLQHYSRKIQIHPVLQQVRDVLGPALKGRVTDLLTSSYTIDQGERIYFDDFLGDGDFDSLNHTQERAEDRIFTTAMAVNTLLTTWTVHDDVRKRLIWEQDTPLKVFETVRQGVNWLDMYAVSGRYKPWNTFFSGSIKGYQTFPYSYPSNRCEFFNGTKLNDTSKFPSAPTIIGVQGIQTEEWYKEQLKLPHFGRMTPTEFNGYNNDDGFFPFWSSEPYTYTISMMAMSKYQNAVIG